MTTQDDGIGTDQEDIVGSWDALLGQHRGRRSVDYLREFLLVYGKEWNSSKASVALYSVGTAFEAAGRVEEALLAYEELCRRFGELREGVTVEYVVGGLVRRARLLEGRGEKTDALIALYDDALKYYNEAAGLGAQRWTAIAQYQRGLLLLKDGRRLGNLIPVTMAIDQFRALSDRIQGSPHRSVLRESLARAKYGEGDALLDLKQVRAAREAFAFVAAEFKHEKQEVIREIWLKAVLRWNMLIEVPPTPVLITHPMARHWRDAMERDQQRSDDKDFQAYLETKKRELEKWSSERSEELVGGHERAAEILWRHNYEAMPFALLLRSFEMEGFYQAGPRPDHYPAEGKYLHYAVAPTRMTTIESMVLRDLSDLNFLTVANVNSLVLVGKLPRLILSDKEWFSMVDRLVGAASIIIMDAERMTPGVRAELEAVRRNGREGATLLVLPSRDLKSEGRSTELFNEGFGRAFLDYYQLPLREGGL